MKQSTLTILLQLGLKRPHPLPPVPSQMHFVWMKLCDDNVRNIGVEDIAIVMRVMIVMKTTIALPPSICCQVITTSPHKPHHPPLHIPHQVTTGSSHMQPSGDHTCSTTTPHTSPNDWIPTTYQITTVTTHARPGHHLFASPGNRKLTICLFQQIFDRWFILQ